MYRPLFGIKTFFFLLLVILNLSFGSSIILYNDSPFELIAVVEAADGTFLAQESIHPGIQSKWAMDLDSIHLDTPYVPKASITPYRVIWKCPYGGYYSFCAQVSPGSTVKASFCDGAQYCKPKPEKKESPPCCVPCQPEEESKKDEG